MPLVYCEQIRMDPDLTELRILENKKQIQKNIEAIRI